MLTLKKLSNQENTLGGSSNIENSLKMTVSVTWTSWMQWKKPNLAKDVFKPDLTKCIDSKLLVDDLIM